MKIKITENKSNPRRFSSLNGGVILMRLFMKSILFSIMLSLMLFTSIIISGCGKLNLGGNNNPSPLETKNICTGNGGVEINFIKNMPPPQIYEKDRFNIGLRLENKGCYDVVKGKYSVAVDASKTVFIEGATGASASGYSMDQEITKLDGLTRFNPGGGFDMHTIVAENLGAAQDKKEDYEIVTSRVCYNYQTKASADVCINPYIGDTLDTRKDVCQQGKVILDTKQGGPVVVSNIITRTVQTGIKKEMQFDIYIENQGKGNVRKYSDGACDGEPEVTISDVKYSDYHFMGEGFKKIECKPTSIILSGEKGRNVIRCTAEIIQESGAYTTPFVVTLSYAYSVTNTATIKILKSPVEIKNS